MEKQIASLKEEKNDLLSRFSEMEKQIASLNEEKKRLLSSFSTIKKHRASLKEEKNDLLSRISKMEKQVASLKEEKNDLLSRISKMEKQVASSKEEKKEVLSRLSQVAGSQLRDIHPDISDPSDPNRPLKLNVKMSELYDNEWTDALEILNTDCGEQAAIETLLNIVMRCYRMCKSHAEYQFTAIIKALMMDEKMIWQDIEKSVGQMANKCEPYINKCVQYCWLMCTQDPPMCLVDFGRGLEFNSNEMRSFTKSGKFVDFVVWPALYLYENGPLLSKASIQGTNYPAQHMQKPNQQTQKVSNRKNEETTRLAISDSKQQTSGYLDRIYYPDNQFSITGMHRQYQFGMNIGGRKTNSRVNDNGLDHLRSLKPKLLPSYERQVPQIPERKPKYEDPGIM